MLAEASLLMREGDAACLPLFLSAAAMNDDGRFALPKYFDINTADIYYRRCSLNQAIKIYGEDPERYERAMRGIGSSSP